MELIQLTARCAPPFVSRMFSRSHRILRLHSGSSVVIRGRVRSASSCVLLSAWGQEAVRLVGQPLHANALALVGGSAQLDVFVPSGAVLFALVIESSGCISRSTVRIYDVDKNAQDVQRLTRYIMTPHSREESVNDIVERVAAVQAASRREGVVDIPRVAAVATACRFIERGFPAAVSLNELSRHCGVAERTLEYGFRHVYGTTPLTFMRRQRLSRSHLALLGDSMVGSVGINADLSHRRAHDPVDWK